jgi:hypothetical protein
VFFSEFCPQIWIFHYFLRRNRPFINKFYPIATAPLHDFRSYTVSFIVMPIRKGKIRKEDEENKNKIIKKKFDSNIMVFKFEKRGGDSSVEELVDVPNYHQIKERCSAPPRQVKTV